MSRSHAEQDQVEESALTVVRFGGVGWEGDFIFLSSWVGRMMEGSPDGQRWGMKSLFMLVEENKHQVRQNTGGKSSGHSMTLYGYWESWLTE